jgi:RHS repeat-associated protein
MGIRIAKHIYTNNTFTQWERSTYYVRDASGNVMTTYEREATGQEPPSSFRVAERHLYGSSRLGIDATPHEFIGTTYTASPEAARTLGHKHYEISNHLGNVLSVISDQKLPVVVDSTVVSYTAVVFSATDYSPFGVGLYGRSWSEGYRFGFQGQEGDSEIKGHGNSWNFKYRMHDSRLGRFFAVDPIGTKFPYNSPYAFAENQVVAFVELEGLEKATPEQQQNAMNSIDEFKNNENTSSVFENISKDDFVTSLQDILNNPESIDQSRTNLCGIATACKAAIEYNPEEFVAMALSIYQTGEYSNGSITYTANNDLFDNSKSNGLGAAEFVIMTTLRNSLNVLPYDPTNDNGTSGFTYPGDVDNILIKGMSMKKTTNTDWSSSLTNGASLIGGITKAVDAGHIVVLTVNTSQFMGNSSWSVIPDHYIQITGVTENSDGTVNVSWWSWGSQQTPIKMTKDQLYSSTYFYGSFE